MGHLKSSKLRMTLNMVLGVAMVTTFVFPVRAEWDPTFETPQEFNRNEWMRQEAAKNRRVPQSVPSRVRVAQAPAEEPDVDMLFPQSTPPEPVVAPSSKKNRVSRATRAEEAAAAPVVEEGPKKLRHSSKPTKVVEEPVAPAPAPVSQPEVAAQPEPIMPASEGPKKLRRSSKPKSSSAQEAPIASPPQSSPPTVADAPAPAPEPVAPAPGAPSVPKTAPKTSGPVPGPAPAPDVKEETDVELADGEAPIAEPPSDRTDIKAATGAAAAAAAASAKNKPGSSKEAMSPAQCAVPMSPGSGVTQAASATRELQQLAQAGSKKQQYVLLDEKEEEAYKEERKDKFDEAPDATKGPGKFVTRLLEAARYEVSYDHNSKKRPPPKKAIGKAQSWCLQGVRRAIQKAARKPEKSLGRSAKNAGSQLLQYGFKKAAAGKYNERTAPVGAILVYKKRGDAKAHGHIEIRGKDGYYSDFFSKNPLSATAKSRELIGIYLPPTD